MSTVLADTFSKLADMFSNLADMFSKSADMYSKLADMFSKLVDMYSKLPDMYSKPADMYSKGSHNYKGLFLLKFNLSLSNSKVFLIQSNYSRCSFRLAQNCPNLPVTILKTLIFSLNFTAKSRFIR
jgi:hypothetical protein